jgi:hypothetical protein
MSKLLNLQVANTLSQEVASGSLVNLGSVVRKYCKPTACCVPTFSYTNNTNSITLNASGYYDVEFNAVFTGQTAGVGTITMYVNGLPLPQATASETITTANTEVRSVSYSTIVRVLPNAPLTISFVNTSAIDLDLQLSNVVITKIC